MWGNRVSPTSLCGNDSSLAMRDGSQCSSLQNIEPANSMDLFSQSGSSQSQQVKDIREGKEQADFHYKASEKQVSSGHKYYMKFLSQVARQDTPNVNTCTAEQRVGGVVHSKQSLDSWNTSQLEKTESKQLCDVLGRLREDIGGQFTELANILRAEISQGFSSREKTSIGPSLDPQYACILTQLLQGQAEIKQNMQMMNERLEHLSSQVCKLEGVVSEQISQHTAASNALVARLPSADRWAALNATLDHTCTKLDMVISAEHHRGTLISTGHLRSTLISVEQHNGICVRTADTLPQDQAVPHPSAMGSAVAENEESVYTDQWKHDFPSHGKNPLHVASLSVHGLGTPHEHTYPSQLRKRDEDQPKVPTECEPECCESLHKKQCTQPLSRNKATRRGGGAISVLSTPVTRRRSKRVYKRPDEGSPCALTDSPFSALNSHKPVHSGDAVHMSGQFQRSIEALRRRMSVMSDLSGCGESMKEIVQALKQQNQRNCSP